MKTNYVKEKLRRGEPSFGTWLSLGHLHATRVLARSGFDWLTLDMEHGPFDWSDAAVICAAVADAGCVPLVRVPEGSMWCIKRALDAGAFGIVVPMVNTPEQARAAIDAARYPPQGKRSVGGGMHALNFGTGAGEYYERANDEILVVLQTESPQGVRNAEAIYGLEGCDAVFVGPNDLRRQMRSPEGRDPSDEQFEAAIQQVIAAGRRTGTPTGMHVMNPESALKRAEQGMQFIAVGSDLRMMAATAQQWIGRLRPGEAAADLARY